MILYLDTSVLVAALTNEAHTAAVQRYLARQAPGDLTISAWVSTEFAAALSLKVRTGALGIEDRARTAAAYARLVAASVRVVPVPHSAFVSAARFAEQHAAGLRAGDALHVAVAHELGATIVTCDRALSAAAPMFSVPATLLP